MIEYDLSLGRRCPNRRGTLSLLQSEATKVRELLVGELNALIDIAVQGDIHNTLSNDVRNWLQSSPRHELTRGEVFDYLHEQFREASDKGADAYNLVFVINIWVDGTDLYILPRTGNFTSNWLDDNVDIELEDFSFPLSDANYDVNDSAFCSGVWKRLTQIEPMQLHVCSVERFDEFREDCTQ